ncbi:hypothetical protein [Hymenobacter bucti]|uniref:Uncharacterized protein n=1 Tax=Hymenobacter bucti TaxID=1844114 RepID=A0ABW4R0S7_9BACT
MFDLVYAYTQPSALTPSAEGDTLLLATYAENTPASGATSFFRGQLRDA